MEVTVAGELLVDLASKDDLHEHHERIRKALERPHGKIRRAIGSASTTAAFSGSGPIFMVFDPPKPPGGRMWFLQYIAVWRKGLPAEGAVANLFCALAIGAVPRGASQSFAASLSQDLISEGDIVVPGLAVPTGTGGGVPDKGLRVTPQDQVYAVLQGSGLAVSTNYSAVLGYLDLPDTDEAILW